MPSFTAFLKFIIKQRVAFDNHEVYYVAFYYDATYMLSQNILYIEQRRTLAPTSLPASFRPNSRLILSGTQRCAFSGGSEETN